MIYYVWQINSQQIIETNLSTVQKLLDIKINFYVVTFKKCEINIANILM